MNYEQIKNLVIVALASDDELLETLVLKGGNAIHILQMDKKSSLPRTSYDLDFSMENDFDGDIDDVKVRINNTIIKTFDEHGYIVFDYSFSIKPSLINDSLKDFWGGYKIEFKIIRRETYDRLKGNIEKIRREAIPILPNNSPKIEVEISKYEYVRDKIVAKVEGFIVYVYSPEMIVFEKVRALCQQLIQYTEIIPSHSPRSRPRDFYDIHLICSQHEIDPHTSENKEMLMSIFKAKRVPIEFIKEIKHNSEIHRNDWQSVVDTVSVKDQLESFDFYLNFFIETFGDITFPLDNILSK